MSRFLAFALTLALAPSMAAAQAASSATAAPAAVSPKALELFETLAPRATMQELIRKRTLIAFDRVFIKSGLLDKYEAETPDSTKSLREAMLQEVDSILPVEYPLMANAMGAAYQQLLNASDLDTVIAFFHTPTGERVRALSVTTLEASLNQLGESGQLRTKDDVPGAVATIHNDAAASVRQLSQSDLKATAVFAATPAGRKLALAQPQLMAVQERVTIALINRMTPKIQSAVQKVLDQYPSPK